MGTVAAVMPWIAYLVLVGHVPPGVAAALALAVGVVSWAVGRRHGTTSHPLDVGSAATFLVVTVVSLAVPQSVAEPWSVPLSFAGLLAVAVFCGLTGTPLGREFAAVGPTTDVTRSEPFGPMSTRVAWIWSGAAAGMTVSSAIPPAALGEDAVTPPHTALAAVFGWVLPLLLFASAAVASRTVREAAIAAASDPGVVRRTSFVAFRELAIDELYYLAREKVEREVGAGMEAYDVNVGSGGTPLTGDESRESWPATYRVRERR